MAELLKLLETNGAFHSELMNSILPSVLHHTGASSLSSGTRTTAVSDINLNISSPVTSPSTTEHVRPPEMSAADINLNVLDNGTSTGTGLQSNENINNNVADNNGQARVSTPEDQNLNANLATGAGTETVRLKLEPDEAMLSVQDDNANVMDISHILSKVQESPSETRQLLVDQVTNAIVEAHMSTTINTHANVAEANERIRTEIDEMPNLYSLSLNGSNLWQHFIAAMLPEMTKVIKFCTKLPGFPELEQEDKVRLIKEGCFEVMVTRFCLLVDQNKEEMFDPTLKMKAPRHVVQDTPMGLFLDQFFTIAGLFNPLGLTDEEIGLFTAVLVICPEREGLINRSTVDVIQKLFLQSLYLLLKKTHGDAADQKLSALINMLPTLRKINKNHLSFLRMIKMKAPTEFEQKFPPLHKELFDNSS